MRVDLPVQQSLNSVELARDRRYGLYIDLMKYTVAHFGDREDRR